MLRQKSIENWIHEVPAIWGILTQRLLYLHVSAPSSILALLWQGKQETSVNSAPLYCSVRFSSVTQSCLTLCDPMNCSTPCLPVHQQLLESTQTHVHCVSDAIQPSHLLSSPSLPAHNPSQHKGLYQWVSSSHQMDQVLEFQLQHQSFQWLPRTDLL